MQGEPMELSYAVYEAYNKTKFRPEAVKLLISNGYEEAEGILNAMWDAIDATMDMENIEGPMGG